MRLSLVTDELRRTFHAKVDNDGVCDIKSRKSYDCRRRKLVGKAGEPLPFKLNIDIQAEVPALPTYIPSDEEAAAAQPSKSDEERKENS